MHLLTPGDVIPDMNFLGQKGCTLRMVYTYCSIVPKNRPVLTDGSDLACRIYCGCSFVAGYAGRGEVVIEIKPLQYCKGIINQFKKKVCIHWQSWENWEAA